MYAKVTSKSLSINVLLYFNCQSSLGPSSLLLTIYLGNCVDSHGFNYIYLLKLPKGACSTLDLSHLGSYTSLFRKLTIHQTQSHQSWAYNFCPKPALSLLFLVSVCCTIINQVAYARKLSSLVLSLSSCNFLHPHKYYFNLITVIWSEPTSPFSL
jgi:hypothetical protein